MTTRHVHAHSAHIHVLVVAMGEHDGRKRQQRRGANEKRLCSDHVLGGFYEVYAVRMSDGGPRRCATSCAG